MPILSMLFHPSYMMVNIKVLGMVQRDEGACTTFFGEQVDTVECMTGKQLQAAFGIGSSTISILLLASASSFVTGLDSLMSQAYGNNSFKLCGAYRNRMMIVTAMIFTPFLIPIQFVKYLFLFMN